MSNLESSVSAPSTNKEQSISEYIELRGAEEVQQTTCGEICTLRDSILEKMGSEALSSKVLVVNPARWQGFMVAIWSEASE